MENLQNEVWKPVVGYEGYYEISNYGRLKAVERVEVYYRTIKEKILKCNVNSSRYRGVVLSKNVSNKGVLLHRIVAETWIPNPENKPFVNHIDGNKMNNAVENLEWVTRSENMQHAWNTGLMRPGVKKKEVEKRKQGRGCSRPVAKISDDGEIMEVYDSVKKASNSIGMNNSAVSHAIKVDCRAGGYKWVYIDNEEFRDSLQNAVMAAIKG